MLKHKMCVISIIIICLLSGCGNSSIEPNDEVGQDKEQYADNENDSFTFEEYSGNWSYEGKTQEQLLAEGREDMEDNDTTAYPSYDPSWTEEELISAINKRSQFYRDSAYYPEIIDYWENVRETRDISNLIDPLFETDTKYYTKEEFESEPMLVIHLAKNEIYARHGYIFANEDLFNYFMGCVWYSPTCNSTDFDDSILNEYERANLEILADLDIY